MGNYLMQLDPTGNCCNCPNRTSPCDNCSNATNTGACCNLTNFVCTINVTHDQCVNSGGIYLGDTSNCTGVSCSCCPALSNYTQVIFSGQVIGCSGGTVSLPSKTWNRVASGGGCTVSTFEFATDANCGCLFNARDCFPFVEVDYVEVDEIGDCANPNSYSGCTILAHISCNGTVDLEGSSDAFQCCSSAAGLSRQGPYDLTNGPIDMTFNADSGDTTIQFRFILSLA